MIRIVPKDVLRFYKTLEPLTRILEEEWGKENYRDYLEYLRWHYIRLSYEDAEGLIKIYGLKNWDILHQFRDVDLHKDVSKPRYDELMAETDLEYLGEIEVEVLLHHWRELINLMFPKERGQDYFWCRVFEVDIKLIHYEEEE